VAHRQHRLGIIDVHGGREREPWQRCGKDVDQAERRMAGQEMAAAFGAVLPPAELGFLVHRDILRAYLDPQAFGLPQAEAIDGPARPGAAGAAVTVTHRLRRARYLDLDGATKTFP